MAQEEREWRQDASWSSVSMRCCPDPGQGRALYKKEPIPQKPHRMENGKPRSRSPSRLRFHFIQIFFLSLAHVMFLKAPRVVYALVKIPRLFGATDTFSCPEEVVPIAWASIQQGPMVVSL